MYSSVGLHERWDHGQLGLDESGPRSAFDILIATLRTHKILHIIGIPS